MNHVMNSNYMEHGFCFSWEPGLVWIHVASDILTGLAYYAITCAMAYYYFKRRDLPFVSVYIFFALFILACGTTHFFAAYTVYVPDYWPEGYVKAVTAVISLVAALLFIPKIPVAIDMPSLAKTLQEVKLLNARQQLGKERLQRLLSVFQYEARDNQDLLDFALSQAIEMTASRFGYIYFYDDVKRQFILNSWSRGVMPECGVAAPQTLYDLDKTGIWGEVVRQGKAIMVNDFPAEHPLKRGTPEGHVPLLRFLSIPLFDSGRIVAVIGMANKEAEYDDGDTLQLTLLMDAAWKIAERRRTEDELKLKVAELERFTYTVSHDLKSPLVTIKGFAGALERDLADGNYDRMAGDLKRVSNAADKMQNLLSDLLELSRIGRVIHTPEQVDMNELVNDVLQQLVGPLKTNNVSVDVQADLPTVFCDRQRMFEVIQNLVENAGNCMGTQETPRIFIGVREETGRNTFFVQDNGIGIDPKYHQNIFGLFNKLQADSQGTGIGLALVKRIVEIHGGQVWVESEGIGKGSRFCFWVPQQKNSREEHA
ncbi:MAG: GAF domain-containing protein [Desulfuromonadales bacterium]|nr:GAF domain-containing protein [Desulfuromonadales bacterium]